MNIIPPGYALHSTAPNSLWPTVRIFGFSIVRQVRFKVYDYSQPTHA